MPPLIDASLAVVVMTYGNHGNFQLIKANGTVENVGRNLGPSFVVDRGSLRRLVVIVDGRGW
jgi:hypothetical protein